MLVTSFRELRSGETQEGQVLDRLSTIMSTAECVSVGFALGIKGHFLSGGEPTAGDLLDCIAGAAVKDDPEDLKRLRRYLEQRVARRGGLLWKELYEARSRLPG